MVIVDSLTPILDVLKDPVLVLPVFTDHRAHPVQNRLSVLYLLSPERNESYVIPVDHNDGVIPSDYDTFRQHFIRSEEIYGPARDLYFLFPELTWQIHDILGLEWAETNRVKDKSEFFPPIMTKTYEKYKDRHDLNRTIPLMQLLASLDDYARHLLPFMTSPERTFHDQSVVPVIKFLEEGGVYTQKEGLVWSEYNPYTATGRIANARFGMLTKSDGSRKDLISRFPGGKMVSMDFEAFHLRMIGHLIDYTLPSTSVHEWLARHYFDTLTPSKEQYDAGKEMTFQIVYGNGPSDVEFFQQVNAFRFEMWNEIRQNGFVYTDHGVTKLKFIDMPSPHKVFNYVLQTTEMEKAVYAIEQIIPLFKQAKSKVVLYTYDALLIDWHPDDGEKLLRAVKRELTTFGRYPVRVSCGPNYDEMEDLEL